MHDRRISAPPTSTSLDCPACGASLKRRVVAGEALLACVQCDGLLVARAAVARLRDRRLEMDRALPQVGGGEAVPEDPPEVSLAGSSKGAALRPCPSCRRQMHRYAYGGGNTRVETCDDCEHLFFDRGELRAVLEEARNGIAMSDDAKGLLHAHRVVATQERVWNAEVGLSVIGLLAGYFFLQFALDLGMTAVALTVGAAVAITGYLVYRRQLEGEQRDAEGRLDRLMAAEAWRLGEAERAPSAATAKEADAKAPHAKAAQAKQRSCPFCAAPLAAGSTHCSACDSDFG